MSKYHSEDKAVFQKYAKKRRTMTVLFIFMVTVLFMAGFQFSSFGNKKDKYQEVKEISDFEEYKKGRLSGGILSAMNDAKKSELAESQPSSAPADEKRQQKLIKKGKNYEKDSEIIEKYTTALDAGSYSSFQPAGGRRNFIPGGGAQGGVLIKDKKSLNVEKTLNIHNVEIKVKLDYSIRSTASSTVIATVIKGSDTVTEGSKFYGQASGYSNKRTQISFSKLIINGSTYSVKGFAISGRDPGIESEVTDISKENSASSIKQGVARTVSNIAVKLAGSTGSVAGEAASNTVDPASSEIQKQAEADKMTQEYRVPAGTAFFIYLE